MATAVRAAFPASRDALVLTALASALILLVLLSLHIGRYPLSTKQILHALASGASPARDSPQSAGWAVVELIRLPRILLVAVCGMSLSIAGAAMQGVFRNPLVGPEIAGVSSGASFGGALGILLALPLLAVAGLSFASGLLALLIAFLLAKVAGQGRMLALVLSGVVVGAFFGALTSLVELMADPDTTLPTILFWLLGSFANANYPKLAAMAGTLLAAGGVLLLLRWRLNLLSLGESDARALGLPLEPLRWTVISLAALLVAVQVTVSGGVSWVGLILPHLARMLVGPDHTKMMPVAALLGALYLLGMDDLARSLSSGELPIGLLTATLGAPVFAFLFWKTQGRGWGQP